MGKYRSFKKPLPMPVSEELTKALKGLERIAEVTDNWEKICTVAALRVTPLVREELAVSYARTKLQKKTGKLFDAWVTNAQIMGNEKGILIYADEDIDGAVAKQLAAWQYGAVHGPREVHERRDTANQHLYNRGSNKKTSVLGAKSKISIKTAFMSGRKMSARQHARLIAPVVINRGRKDEFTQRRGVSLNEVKVIPARPIVLTNEQMVRITEKFIECVNEEIENRN